MRVGRGEFARPVVAEAEAFDLALELGDVRLGGLARMLARLDGVLLGRQAERIPAHRMQDVEAAEPFVARQDVRGGVALRMADVQTRAARIGKHVEDVKFRFAGIETVASPGLERVESLSFSQTACHFGSI